MSVSRRARLALPLVAAALAFAVTACGGSTPGTGSASDLEAAKATASELIGSGGAPVDACALLKPADVQAIIGTTVEGKPDTAPGDAGGCTWENQENYYSVTVSVGGSGTAPGGTLPAAQPERGTVTPMSGGMRGLSGGIVQFVADERLCEVQVATNSGAQDQQKAAGVANKVRAAL
ncbi:MAG: DUF3558 family protein [Pseudonocardia sp.]|uniref:DUF3558 family protein n=1 Tax=unclassified Pseudonocardia TaxID=2619320 RepID=UPI00086C6D18|nr:MULTISPECIES: DUF3558 family protein [unclassified Pseudonocardia]MBN9110362.1 DUF3558 family protein [Pseudonocardia sp.]ODU28315.1 MAG: hypothetical protein ABS80_02690 [Pseudonocardia sp. SCN 72-51]ODV03867.1 MAG: hypothetical protein ABT15_21705 [Pseudonocardia sp. SCN 73-27]